MHSRVNKTQPKTRSSSSTPTRLYETYVRPKLEYSSAIWSPNQLHLINHLEAIENCAARFIASSYSRDTSITALKRSLGLVPLNTRRIISRFVLQKFYYRHPYAHPSVLERPNKTSARLNHFQGIKRTSGHTTAFNSSFSLNSVATWNNLLPHIACITDSPKFDEHEKDHFSLVPD